MLPAYVSSDFSHQLPAHHFISPPTDLSQLLAVSYFFSSMQDFIPFPMWTDQGWLNHGSHPVITRQTNSVGPQSANPEAETPNFVSPLRSERQVSDVTASVFIIKPTSENPQPKTHHSPSSQAPVVTNPQRPTTTGQPDSNDLSSTSTTKQNGHQSRPYKCSYCEKTVSYRHNQITHERTHT